MQLATGRYSAEWFNVASREVAAADAVSTDADGRVEFAPPWSTGPAVLYLTHI